MSTSPATNIATATTLEIKPHPRSVYWSIIAPKSGPNMAPNEPVPSMIPVLIVITINYTSGIIDQHVYCVELSCHYIKRLRV